MPITVNEGGTLYTLDTITANEGGTLYELDTVYSNEGGTLYEIHNGVPSSLTWVCNPADTSAVINSTSNSGLYIDCVTDSYGHGFIVPSIYAKTHLSSGTIITYSQTPSSSGAFILGINDTLLDKIILIHDLKYSGQGASGSITITTSGDYYISISASAMPQGEKNRTRLTLQFTR